jgi:hypothetical protein
MKTKLLLTGWTPFMQCSILRNKAIIRFCKAARPGKKGHQNIFLKICLLTQHSPLQTHYSLEMLAFLNTKVIIKFVEQLIYTRVIHCLSCSPYQDLNVILTPTNLGYDFTFYLIILYKCKWHHQMLVIF